MARVRRRVKHRRELSPEEEDELEFGPGGWDDVGHAVFASDDERRAAWIVHRSEFMDELAEHCRRPWGFYQFELGAHPPQPDEHIASTYAEADFLEARGLLSDAERVELMRRRVEEASRYARFARDGIPLNDGQQRFLEHARRAKWIREPAA